MRLPDTTLNAVNDYGARGRCRLARIVEFKLGKGHAHLRVFACDVRSHTRGSRRPTQARVRGPRENRGAGSI